MPKPDPMGSSFAERAAAARGDKDFDAPEPDAQEPDANSTFADRAKAAKKSTSKTVEGGDAENKAVSSASTKKRAAKKS